MILINFKANILIDKDGRARLTHFGPVSSIQEERLLDMLKGNGMSSMENLAAPEILGGEAPTKEGDVFMFAMVAIEVCSAVFKRGLHAYLSR